MKTAICEESKCFYFIICLFQLDSSAKSKIERLQLYLPYFANNQFESDTEIALGPTGPDKSLDSLYL